MNNIYKHQLHAHKVAISCNYARTAVRTIAQGLYTHSGLPSGALHEIKKQYHEVLKDTPSMHLTCQVSKLITIKSMLKKFNKHWYPKENRVTYLETFSCNNWKALSNAQKTLPSYTHPTLPSYTNPTLPCRVGE